MDGNIDRLYFYCPIATSYVAATSGALVTALGLNAMVKHAPPLIGRFVPFCAVAAANCVNIPLMRQLELKNGNIGYFIYSLYFSL